MSIAPHWLLPCLAGAVLGAAGLLVHRAYAGPSVTDARGSNCVIDNEDLHACASGHCCYTTYISRTTGLIAHRFGCCPSNQGCALPSEPDENGDWIPTCSGGGGSPCDGCDGVGIL
ncbi:MAG: hypothetical protein D6693_05525 [Planctomycetota bacterium]|nr:MAG: hypothetical protein D6693_05525 [Planctomycetota bacterium]